MLPNEGKYKITRFSGNNFIELIFGMAEQYKGVLLTIKWISYYTQNEQNEQKIKKISKLI